MEDTSLVLHHQDLEFTALTSGSADSSLPPILCLHGFPDLPWTFRHQMKAFAEAGYYTICVRARGYEPSSQPSNKDYSLGTMVTDIFAWLDELNLAKVHLVGHDWGAILAYLAAAKQPKRFYSLSTLAIPHLGRLTKAIRKVPSQIFKSSYITFFQFYGIAEMVIKFRKWAFIKRLWKKWSPTYTLEAEEWDKIRHCLEQKGVLKAMLSYYRQNMSLAVSIGLKKNEMASLKVVDVPTLALTGVEDGCVDSRLHDFCFHEEDFPKGYRVERIPNAGHFLHLEQPEIVNQLLLDWFGRCT
ncbi:MAG: alpha/beta hydrolase [Saprospiraceae bacterium]|nr:alpha/beta hydrolase [Saprospiraceae bacterium]